MTHLMAQHQQALRCPGAAQVAVEHLFGKATARYQVLVVHHLVICRSRRAGAKPSDELSERCQHTGRRKEGVPLVSGWTGLLSQSSQYQSSAGTSANGGFRQ